MNDFGVITAPDTVHITRRLPGPIERVWAYLTEFDKRAQWLASGPMDLRPGGAIALTFNNSELTGNDGTPPPKYAAHACQAEMTAEVLECDPPHLLRQSWGKTSEVCFTLTAEGDQVVLEVLHTRLPDRDNMLSVSAGWHAHLEILIARLKGETPPGFWPLHTQLEAAYDQRLPQAP